MFQNLLWVYGMAWMSVSFPGLKFCPSPPLTPLIIGMINESLIFIVSTYELLLLMMREFCEFQSKQNSTMTNLNASDWLNRIVCGWL